MDSNQGNADLQRVPTGVNRDSNTHRKSESNALIRRRASQCMDHILVS
jgi:hypothetical protein